MAFLFFTALHIFANYRAVKAVRFETLNRSRFLILLKYYITTMTVQSVEETNDQEPVFSNLTSNSNQEIFIFLTSACWFSNFEIGNVCGYKIFLGKSIKSINPAEIEESLADYLGNNYAIIPDECDKAIYIIYKKETSPEEMLESYYYAVLSAMLVSKKVMFAIPWQILLSQFMQKYNLNSYEYHSELTGYHLLTLIYIDCINLRSDFWYLCIIFYSSKQKCHLLILYFILSFSIYFLLNFVCKSSKLLLLSWFILILALSSNYGLCILPLMPLYFYHPNQVVNADDKGAGSIRYVLKEIVHGNGIYSWKHFQKALTEKGKLFLFPFLVST